MAAVAPTALEQGRIRRDRVEDMPHVVVTGRLLSGAIRVVGPYDDLAAAVRDMEWRAGVRGVAWEAYPLEHPDVLREGV